MAGERVRRLVSSLSQSSSEPLSVGNKPYNKTARSILADVAKNRDTSSETKEPNASYAELWDGLDACLEQANGTKQSTKDIAVALGQWAAAEKEYISRLPCTRKKFDLPSCEAGTLGLAIDSFCTGFGKIASARARMSSVVGAMCSQLHQFRREQNLTKKKLELEGTKLRRGMQAQEQTFQRARQKYDKACKDAELCISLKEKAHQEKALHEVSKLWQRTTDALIAVQESEQQYRLAVEELRSYRANYTAGMQRLLEELQILEESRIEYVKALLHGVVDSFTELANQSEAMLEDLREKANETDSARDIKDFVNKHLRPPLEPVTFEKLANAKIEAEIEILVGGGIVSASAAGGAGSSPVQQRFKTPSGSNGAAPGPYGPSSPRSLGSSPSPHSSFSGPGAGAPQVTTMFSNNGSVLHPQQQLQQQQQQQQQHDPFNAGFLHGHARSASAGFGTPPQSHHRSSSHSGPIDALAPSTPSGAASFALASRTPPPPPNMHNTGRATRIAPATPGGRSAASTSPQPLLSKSPQQGGVGLVGFGGPTPVPPQVVPPRPQPPTARTQFETPPRPQRPSLAAELNNSSGSLQPLELSDEDDQLDEAFVESPKAAAPSSPEHLEASYVQRNPPQVEFVRALYDYIAEEDSELSLRVGDILQVVEKDDSGWWEGRKRDGSQGSFPENYTQAASAQQATAAGFSDPGAASSAPAPRTRRNSTGAQAESPVHGAAPVPASQPSSAPPETASGHLAPAKTASGDKASKLPALDLSPALTACSEEAPSKQVIVIFDYEAQDPCDLTIKKREVLTVHGIDEDGGWLDASDSAGNRGMVPANYTRPLQPVAQSAVSA